MSGLMRGWCGGHFIPICPVSLAVVSQQAFQLGVGGKVLGAAGVASVRKNTEKTTWPVPASSVIDLLQDTAEPVGTSVKMYLMARKRKRQIEEERGGKRE